MTRALMLSALSLLACGCYFDRLTGNYTDLMQPEEIKDGEAIIAESGKDAEAERIRRERLSSIAAEEDSVYRMNAGDQIEIRVYGHEDLGMVTKIGPDGSIGLAFIGQMKVSGLTIGEASDAIRDGLKPYVKNPVVSVTVREVSSETATISGACAHPSVYSIANTTRLSDLYAQAGGSATHLFNGMDVDVADLEHSILVRNGEILPVDFRMAIEVGDVLNNVRIRKGDYVYIAQRMESSVTVCGEVRKPHKRLYEAGMKLIETLTAAGWMMDTHWSHVIIIREGLANPKMYKVDVDGILAGKCRDVPLKAGDIVYVPKDNLSEYNVFIRKLLPTAQLVNLLRSTSTAFTSE